MQSKQGRYVMFCLASIPSQSTTFFIHCPLHPGQLVELILYVSPQPPLLSQRDDIPSPHFMAEESAPDPNLRLHFAHLSNNMVVLLLLLSSFTLPYLLVSCTHSEILKNQRFCLVLVCSQPRGNRSPKSVKYCIIYLSLCNILPPKLSSLY